MKKLVFVLGVLVLASTAYAAAPYTGPWSLTWDFSDGTEGWVLTGSGYWTDPNSVPPEGPTLPDGQPSGGGNANLYLPDTSYARLDVSALNLGTGAGRVAFVFQADVYIPNLRPLGGFPWNYPGNMNHQAGIGVLRSDLKAAVVEGYINNGQVRVRDFTWDNTWHGPAWTMEEVVEPDSLWWDNWITLQLDYGFTTPGKWSAHAYIPWQSPASSPGWITLGSDLEVNSGVHWAKLQLGGAYSWTQAQFDNAKLVYVPEPGSLLALGVGLVGLWGAVRRRR